MHPAAVRASSVFTSWSSEPQRIRFPNAISRSSRCRTSRGPRPSLDPTDRARTTCCCMHGEVEGVLPKRRRRDRSRADRDPAATSSRAARWAYVALGHYHVHREIAPNAYYSGSLDYTSANPWGELARRPSRAAGKGFIEYDLDDGRAHVPSRCRRRASWSTCRLDCGARDVRGRAGCGDPRVRRGLRGRHRREDRAPRRARRAAPRRPRAGSQGAARVQAARDALPSRHAAPRDHAARGQRRAGPASVAGRHGARRICSARLLDERRWIARRSSRSAWST